MYASSQLNILLSNFRICVHSLETFVKLSSPFQTVVIKCCIAYEKYTKYLKQ